MVRRRRVRGAAGGRGREALSRATTMRRPAPAACPRTSHRSRLGSLIIIHINYYWRDPHLIDMHFQVEAVKRVRRCKNYYEILGLSKDSSDADLKKAYRY